MGVILGLPLSGVLAEHLGWEYVFYVTGGMGLIWGIAWTLLVSESPSRHSRISQVSTCILDLKKKFRLSHDFTLLHLNRPNCTT